MNKEVQWHITNFRPVSCPHWRPLLTPVDIVKSSATLNERAFQKLIEMRLNPQITHTAPNPNKNVDWLPCGIKNWIFKVMQAKLAGLKTCWIPVWVIMAQGHSSDLLNTLVVGRSEIKFQWKYLKGIGCKWDLLHGMSSGYPQTAG